MTFDQHKHAIGVFSSRKIVEQALRELKDTGFAMNKISVLTKDTQGYEQFSSENPSKLTLTRSEGVACFCSSHNLKLYDFSKSIKSASQTTPNTIDIDPKACRHALILSMV